MPAGRPTNPMDKIRKIQQYDVGVGLRSCHRATHDIRAACHTRFAAVLQRRVKPLGNLQRLVMALNVPEHTNAETTSDAGTGCEKHTLH